MVNTRRNSAFICAVNKTLKAKYLMHNFHFIDNSNIKKEHLWKDGLDLNRSGKYLLTKYFLQNISNFLRKKRKSKWCFIRRNFFQLIYSKNIKVCRCFRRNFNWFTESGKSRLTFMESMKLKLVWRKWKRLYSWYKLLSHVFWSLLLILSFNLLISLFNLYILLMINAFTATSCALKSVAQRW